MGLDRLRLSPLLSGTVLLGFVGSVLLATMAVGAGGILVSDPVISGGPLSWIRYGHGHDLAAGDQPDLLQRYAQPQGSELVQ